MKTAIVFLCRTPKQELIDFAQEINKDDFDTYISIDDNKFDATELPVNVIQYDNKKRKFL